MPSFKGGDLSFADSRDVNELIKQGKRQQFHVSLKHVSFNQRLTAVEGLWLHVHARIYNHYDVYMGGCILVSMNNQSAEPFAH